MSLRKDNAGRRYVEMTLELPGTPDEVWRVMATGPGYAAWFMPADIEERVGGALTFDFGQGMTSGGKVTVWEPPHRFCYEEYNWSGEAPPVATEITIEAQAGGTCTMRMVHSLFTDRDDWDKEVESFEKGWPGFFRVLRLYLTFFSGLHAAPIMVRGGYDGSVEEAWRALQDLLKLDGLGEGDRIDTGGADAPHLAGVVAHVDRQPHHTEILLRLDAPTKGAALLGAFQAGEAAYAGISVIFYGDEADAVKRAEEPRWAAWMERHFKVETPAA